MLVWILEIWDLLLNIQCSVWWNCILLEDQEKLEIGLWLSSGCWLLSLHQESLWQLCGMVFCELDHWQPKFIYQYFYVSLYLIEDSEHVVTVLPFPCRQIMVFIRSHSCLSSPSVKLRLEFITSCTAPAVDDLVVWNIWQSHLAFSWWSLWSHKNVLKYWEFVKYQNYVWPLLLAEGRIFSKTRLVMDSRTLPVIKSDRFVGVIDWVPITWHKNNTFGNSQQCPCSINGLAVTAES
jgi:hypothetical protein